MIIKKQKYLGYLSEHIQLHQSENWESKKEQKILYIIKNNTKNIFSKYQKILWK